MNPKALKLLSDYLTEKEKSEILDYDEIFYSGEKYKKANFNYKKIDKFDNNNFEYIINIGDHFCYRYEIISILGKGAFGEIVKCMDHKNGEMVAIKIFKNTANIIKQGRNEINMLNLIQKLDNNNSNIVIMKTSFTFRSHLCIVFELLSINLYEYLKERKFKGLEINDIRNLANQILRTLYFLHKNKIVHCDIKPENLLFTTDKKDKVKVIDLGSSCYELYQCDYSYIQSRYYRSPEILFGTKFGCQIDIWSFGCTLAELYICIS